MEYKTDKFQVEKISKKQVLYFKTSKLSFVFIFIKPVEKFLLLLQNNFIYKILLFIKYK